MPNLLGNGLVVFYLSIKKKKKKKKKKIKKYFINKKIKITVGYLKIGNLKLIFT
jgi:hypothetical protein